MSKEALIVIDMQNDYYPGGDMELAGIMDAHIATNQAIKDARKNGNEVVFIQHIVDKNASFFRPETRGVELYSGLDILLNDTVIQKHYPNSFRETSLHQHLQKRSIEKLAICGAMTHMCIDTTVRAAYDLGYEVKLIGDATATKDLSRNGSLIPASYVQNAFLAALDGTFCKVVPSSI